MTKEEGVITRSPVKNRREEIHRLVLQEFHLLHEGGRTVIYTCQKQTVDGRLH